MTLLELIVAGVLCVTALINMRLAYRNLHGWRDLHAAQARLLDDTHAFSHTVARCDAIVAAHAGWSTPLEEHEN